MMWKAHALIGALFALSVLYLLGTRGVLELGMVALVGALSALAPDLDHEQSKGKQILDVAFMSGAFFVLYVSSCGESLCIPKLAAITDIALMFLALMGVYFLFFKFFKPEHRGITHTLVACFVFCVLVYLIAGWTFAVAGLVGYFSHLVADRHIKLV